MLTGIIEGLGLILSMLKINGQLLLKIKPLFAIDKYQQGESIAVNGVCLTVCEYSDEWFKAYVSEETYKNTNLNKLKQNSLVNLERALKINDRFGGHFVTGHVDGIAIVKNIIVSGKSKIFALTYQKQFSDLIVKKGSVALDGVSLTVNSCEKNFFKINVIPETLNSTIIKQWYVGYQANIEFDLLGKYVTQKIKEPANKLTESFLAEHGYM
jgi:riboflavin synthase